MLPSGSVDADASKTTVPSVAVDDSAAAGLTLLGVSVGGAASGADCSASCAVSGIAGTRSAAPSAQAAITLRKPLAAPTLTHNLCPVGARVAIRRTAAIGGMAVLLLVAGA